MAGALALVDIKLFDQEQVVGARRVASEALRCATTPVRLDCIRVRASADGWVEDELHWVDAIAVRVAAVRPELASACNTVAIDKQTPVATLSVASRSKAEGVHVGHANDGRHVVELGVGD